MIKFFNKKLKKYKQIFKIFTEENWEAEKKNYESSFQNFFSGKKNEIAVKTDEKSIIYFIGIGKNSASDFEIQQTANKFAYAYKDKILSEITLLEADFDESQIHEFLTGLLIGTYYYPFSYKHPLLSEKFELHYEKFSQKKLDVISKKSEAIFNGQTASMEWLNKPANFKSTELISAYLKNLAKEKKLKYTLFNRKKCEELGLGAYLSVNQGSAKDAAFTILEYKSAAKNAKTVGLVGKCVLFDTGGISLKNPDNMHYMKSDMGGATAVIGTLIAASEMQLPINIVAILPITDNAISRDAYLPSDVITAYNGKTIEVLNTDAEGRMTLADGLSYLAKNYRTDYLLDLATLTGSAVRMFGDTCGALFTNDQILLKNLISSADKTNQRLWNLPLWDIWKDDFRSDVADFKNISLKPIGDCIVAAKFLEQFTEDHPSWAHLDIAGVAFGNVNYAKEKAATGYGVQLLIDFLENLR